MKISLRWLSELIDTKAYSPQQIADMLTGCGLEVEGIEQIEPVKGGLAGLVVGHVVKKWKHPGADALSLTLVDYGIGQPVQVVCGAANVAEGQKVVFAPVGTTLYPIEGDGFTIKKAKIRGEESHGMICAEDEIGIGHSHEGILILPNETAVGKPISEVFDLETDTVLEVAILPNRCDAASHMGVARDLNAVMNALNRNAQVNVSLKIPEGYASEIGKGSGQTPVSIVVEEPELCPRYAGVCIKGVRVAPSPDWLQKKLKLIGLNPINNVVDITNYVLHECGQPLHAFDMAKIEGKTIIVRKAGNKQVFTTLDGKQRNLTGDELMICDAEKPLVIAGVFGGLHSGVTDETQDIFLESACFQPATIRSTSKLHNIKTDSSFRFERGTDIELVVPALKRAATFICEIAGGEIDGKISDVYSIPHKPIEIELAWLYLNRLVGVEMDRNEVKHILKDTGFTILNENHALVLLGVHSAKQDITRPADVVEEIIRIYGPNRIPDPDFIRISASLQPFNHRYRTLKSLANTLVSNGMFEAMNNSLTSGNAIADENAVALSNPLSSELNVMRTSLLPGLLQSAAFNFNRKAKSVRLFEFGRTYVKSSFNASTRLPFVENEQLGILIAGNDHNEHYQQAAHEVTFFTLKKFIDLASSALGVNLVIEPETDPQAELKPCFVLYTQGNIVGKAGKVCSDVKKKFDVEHETWFASVDIDNLLKISAKTNVRFSEIPKFPEVRRDLALLIDKQVLFKDIKTAIAGTDKKLIKHISLFDVFEGKNIPEGKKSYAIGITLQSEERTLQEAEIEKTMQHIVNTLHQKYHAVLRS